MLNVRSGVTISEVNCECSNKTALLNSLVRALTVCLGMQHSHVHANFGIHFKFPYTGMTLIT